MAKLKEALGKLAEDYKKEFEREIVAKEMVASGKLKKSLQVKLEKEGFSISSDEIHSYLLGDRGYRPTRTGSKADKEAKWDRLGEWAKSKGMQPLLRDKKGRFKKVTKDSYRRLGFLLSRSLNEKGSIERFNYKGSNVISSVVDKLSKKSEDVIVEAFEEEIVAMIKEDFKFDNIKIQ